MSKADTRLAERLARQYAADICAAADMLAGRRIRRAIDPRSRRFN